MNPAFLAYGALALAIGSEVSGNTLLMKSEQFTKLFPTLGMVVCYASSFYFLTVALKSIPLGVTYAVWSGLGMILTVMIGRVAFKQLLDFPALIGIALIIGGILVMNLFSKTVGH